MNSGKLEVGMNASVFAGEYRRAAHANDSIFAAVARGSPLRLEINLKKSGSNPPL
jgi:hypothetical protein